MYMNDGIKTKINLRSKSVFITGVAGFIGSNLAKRLLSTVEDVKVVGLDNMNHYYDGKNMLQIKRGGCEDYISAESLVECIHGLPVKSIEFFTAENQRKEA